MFYYLKHDFFLIFPLPQSQFPVGNGKFFKGKIFIYFFLNAKRIINFLFTFF